MKNIHLLPTDKPSNGYILGKCIKELSDVKIGQFTKTYYLMFNKEYFQPHNIYITSDEEIKKGDGKYPVLGCKGTVYKDCPETWKESGDWKKIILTTDQDLIKDGVQEISDEFLEWFVKNPSCEEVKTKLIKDSEDHPEIVGGYKEEWEYYEIIIPKEEPKQTVQEYEQQGLEKHSHELEPKQDLEKEMFELEQELDILSHLRWHNSKPKQETLEEFTENYINKFYNDYAFKDLLKPLLIEGANWQAERMYSEEDMKQAFFDGVRVTGEGYNGEYASGNHPDIEVEFYESYTEWFNKIKKK